MRETAYTIEAMRLEDIPEVLPLEREAFKTVFQVND